MRLYNVYTSAIAVAALSFALGRYSNRGITSTVDVTKEHEIAQDTKKITVVITAPDGKKTTKETTEIDTHVSTGVKKTVDTQIKPKQPAINFSALVGSDVNKHFEPIYGISVSKEFVGPVTAGIWTLNNGTIGLSLGVNF